MAKPTDCAHCQKPATIHLTQIVDGKITKLDFCEDCPHQKEVSDPEAFSLAQMLASHAMEDQQAQASLAAACPDCGLTLKDFKRSGRLGCSVCYETFRRVVTQMLPQMQGGDTHRGKHPADMLERMALARRGAELEEALSQAVKDENYEEAARVRDALKAWQAARDAAAERESRETVASGSAGAEGSAENFVSDSAEGADNNAESGTSLTREADSGAIDGNGTDEGNDGSNDDERAGGAA